MDREAQPRACMRAETATDFTRAARLWTCRLASCLLAIVAFDADALPDDLDPSFGLHGVVRLDLPASELSDLLVDGQGRIHGNVGCSRFAPQGKRGVLRMHPNGRVDASFGVAQGFTECPVGFDSGWPVFMALTPAHQLVLATGGVTEVAIARFNAGGLVESLTRAPVPAVPPEHSFFPGGRPELFSIAVDRHNRVLAGMSVVCGDVYLCTAMVVRWNADGTLDRTFGDGGAAYLRSGGAVARFAFHADDRISVGIEDRDQYINAGRLLSDGRADPGFGIDGVVHARNWGAGETTTGLVVQRDDKVIVGGSMAFGPGIAYAVRFDATGAFDLRYADQAALVPQTLGSTGRVALALQADGKLLVAGVEDNDFAASGRLFVARFNEDGTPDLYFGGGGFAMLPRGYGRNAVKLAVTPDGGVLVADALRVRDALPDRDAIRYPVLYRLEGGSAPLQRLFREARAIEYFHASFGHYFITALDLEIENLDVHAPGGWARTGRSFRVWSHTDSGASPVCRFFSDQAFAPKSSHFYTSYADECELLKRGTVWRHEGTAFFLQQPVGGPGAGTCPAGSRPLYRAYNNGQTGAPNHRYTIEPVVLDDMLAKGWTFEGEAQTRIFACVPLLQ